MSDDLEAAPTRQDGIKSTVLINNEVTDPTGGYAFSYLLHQSHETPFHDFKRTINIAKGSPDFPKIIKDVYAFSNYGGGWLVLGVRENDYSDPEIKGKFIKAGLPDDFQLDDASLQEKINSYLDEPIGIKYNEFFSTINDEKRKFALIYFSPSSKIMIPPRDVIYRVGDKKKTAVEKGTVYTRRGTQSIPASAYEKGLIDKRLLKEEYRLSILSGEPDEIEEILYSNLFEVKSIPEKIYTGAAQYGSFHDEIEALRAIFPGQRHFPLNYATIEGKTVTFANLADFADIHSKLVNTSTVSKEHTLQWVEDQDKANIVMGLLNRELAKKAMEEGMKADRSRKKLYYEATGGNERKEQWSTKHRGVQQKQVVKKMWAQPLSRHAYLHQAVKATIMRIGGNLYLRLNPTMVVTTDGRTPQTSIGARAFITSRSYGIYNKQQLNSILFWIDKLGGGGDISLGNNFTISREPVRTYAGIGIAWDIPVADWKKFAEEFSEGVEYVDSTDGVENQMAGEETYDF